MNLLNHRDAECSWCAPPSRTAFHLEDEDFDEDSEEDDEFEDDDEDSDEDEDDDEEVPETWQVVSGRLGHPLFLLDFRE
jgi:hypothetical protein